MDRLQRRPRGRRSSSSRPSARPATPGSTPLTGEFEDLVKAGVIDPAKVTRSALQNAASIAGLLLTTEALVADKPEKPNPAAAAAAAAVAAAWVAWAAWAAWAGWASEPVRSLAVVNTGEALSPLINGDRARRADL